MRKSCMIGSFVLMAALISWTQEAVTASEVHKGLADSKGISEKIVENVPEAAIVNVLELGVKNDGSEDVSSIVNEATEKYRLYFPAGCYKVEHPIFLKHSIIGDGYSRNNDKSETDTWFISAMDSTDTSASVLNYANGARLNIENLNIRCSGLESGIRIEHCSQATMTLVDRVGIFSVQGYGIYVHGTGSRPVFLQNITIFGTSLPVPGIGIYCNNADNRFMNIEIMGMRVAIELASFAYGSNLHLWTGCMGGADDGKWWRGTRGILLHNGGVFVGSQIYPDTCFYALEQTSPNCMFAIQNIIYWEDQSTRGSNDFDGAFFHCDGDFEGNLQINGGFIAAMRKSDVNGRMKSLYMAGQKIKDVLLRTQLPILAENVDKLCLCDTLPDYSVTYTEKGFCKVADVFTVADSGFMEAVVSLDNGACWQLSSIKSPGKGVETDIKPMNPLCEGYGVKAVETSDKMVGIYVQNAKDEPITARFTTKSMNRYFRPVDYGYLRTESGRHRLHEVRESL